MAIFHEVMGRIEQADLVNYANIIPIDEHVSGYWIRGSVLLHLRTKAELVDNLAAKELERLRYEFSYKLLQSGCQ